MKTFYAAQEIEDLARQGVRELLVDENVVLTDLARQTAEQLGLRLVQAGSLSAPAVHSGTAPADRPVRPQAARSGPVLTPVRPAPVPDKPRGCQHASMVDSSTPGTMSSAGNAAGGGKVIDDLVSAVKQLSKSRP